MNEHPNLSEAKNALKNIKYFLMAMPLKDLIECRNDAQDFIADYDNFSLKLNEILELIEGDWE